jgi:hypothetical protein
LAAGNLLRIHLFWWGLPYWAYLTVRLQELCCQFFSEIPLHGRSLDVRSFWLVGAGFAPLVALGLSAHFGLAYVSLYLLSGAACSIAALSLNRALEIKTSTYPT